MASSRLARFPERAQHPECEQQTAAAEVPDHVQGYDGFAAAGADLMQQARETDVIQIMSRGLRERTGLPPPRHASVYQTRIAREARLGPDAEPFGHPGAERLDEYVRFFDHGQDHLAGARLLQIERDGTAVAQQR